MFIMMQTFLLASFNFPKIYSFAEAQALREVLVFIC